jgi:hypothetical protein
MVKGPLTPATVIITSPDAKLEQAKSLGADHLINYRTDPLLGKTGNGYHSVKWRRPHPSTALRSNRLLRPDQLHRLLIRQRRRPCRQEEYECPGAKEERYTEWPGRAI